MWILKGFLFLAFAIVLVYFVLDNNDKSVDIDVFNLHFYGISVLWVVLVSGLVGFALSFMVAAFREVRFHLEIRGLKKNLKQRDTEIAELRTLPLSDPSDSTDIVETEAEASE